MEEPIPDTDVVPHLWSAYKKSVEYQNGMIHAIPAHNKLVEDQERRGLGLIYTNFVRILSSGTDVKQELKGRTIKDWLDEWKSMHRSLFGNILKNCGDWRSEMVRFGDVGDEDLYHIPSPQKLNFELSTLAKSILETISKTNYSDEEFYKKLASIHYQCIRIHPFRDGNGRIARAITDQLAIYYGYPVAMGGYPRLDIKRRSAYHQAIRSCIDDPNCQKLADWIKSYIDIQLKKIA
jgi:Fic family protein